MGLVTDKTAIQFRILNRSKGPAMWSRAQCDRNKFIWTWREILENIPNLHIWQGHRTEILVENGEVTGLTTVWGVTFRAKCVVLTAGTFLNGLMHVGRTMLPGGRMKPATRESPGTASTDDGVRIDERAWRRYGDSGRRKPTSNSPYEQRRTPPGSNCRAGPASPMRKHTASFVKGCRILPFSTGRFKV